MSAVAQKKLLRLCALFEDPIPWKTGSKRAWCINLKEADESKHFPFLRSRLVSTSHGNFPLVTSFFEDSGGCSLDLKNQR